MHIWIVIGGWDEGYSLPIGVFSTLDKAEEAKARVGNNYGEVDIIEYVIDQGQVA